MKLLKAVPVLILILLLTAMLPALADTAEVPETITIRYGQNLAAYSRPYPDSTFVGWAKMSQQYSVLEAVRGNKGRTWYLVRLDNGITGYIPSLYTSPVVKNAEEIAQLHVIVHHQGSILIHRKPDSFSCMMGWAWKTQVYPVIGPMEDGWWHIAMPDGTTGYVTSEYAHEYDPIEDTKDRTVIITNRVVIRKEPNFKSEILTGIGPNDSLKCVHVTDKGWYEVETKSGGYGFIYSSVVKLVENDSPTADAQ